MSFLKKGDHTKAIIYPKWLIFGKTKASLFLYLWYTYLTFMRDFWDENKECAFVFYLCLPCAAFEMRMPYFNNKEWTRAKKAVQITKAKMLNYVHIKIRDTQRTNIPSKIQPHTAATEKSSILKRRNEKSLFCELCADVFNCLSAAFSLFRSTTRYCSLWAHTLHKYQVYI